MDFLSFREYLTRIFEKNGLETYAQEDQIRKFYDLTSIMVETNKVMNITALTTEDKIIPLHYADCVKAAEYIPQNATVADNALEKLLREYMAKEPAQLVWDRGVEETKLAELCAALAAYYAKPSDTTWAAVAALLE